MSAEDVRRYVADSAFARGAERVGAELEWITYLPSDPRAYPAFDEVRELAAGAGLLRSAITFEPGGQLELSTPPEDDVAAACATLAADTASLREGFSSQGIALAGIGLDPVRGHRRVLRTPRYAAMERYFDAGGPAGRRMMCRTAALQVNIDPGADPQRRWRTAHLIGPALAAAFANSPFIEGRLSPWRSARLATWWAMDRTRTSPVSQDVPPHEAWTRYVLEANVMLIRAGEERFLPVMETLPFERWLAQGHALGYPAIDDLEYHLTTLFPPIRPRGWLELRMIDAQPDPWWRAAIAVPVALLYDEEAGERARRAAAHTGASWIEALADGPGHPALRPAVEACFAAALEALPRIGGDPPTVDAVAGFADRYAYRGRCPADDLVDDFRARGGTPPFEPTAEPAGSR
jgi:glutamate--cysteine ligase